MKRWAKVHSRLELGSRQQVTRLGLWFTLACLIVGLAAFASANNLLFLILAAMLATLMVSGFISRLSLAGLEMEFLLPEHLAAGRTLTGRIVVRNEKSWMPSFSIHLAAPPDSGLRAPIYFPVIPGGARIEEPVELFFSRRGSYRENSFRFSTRFPFGFTERRINVLLRREVLVYPSIDPKPGFDDLLLSITGDIESFYRGTGHDFYRIRPYEAFESARHVDWRATAHTGNLQVREFAREQDRKVVIYFDLDSPPESEGWFESAVDCAAFLAFRLAERGAHVRFQTQEYDVCAPGDADIYTILKYLALVSPRRGKPPAAPDDPASFHLVFSANVQRMLALGWGASDSRGARLLGLDAFLTPAPASQD